MIRFYCILTAIVISFTSAAPVDAQWRPALYDLYLDLGSKSLQAKDYENALAFYEEAQRQFPEGQEAIDQINLIKRAMESRTSGASYLELPPSQTQRMPAAEYRQPVAAEPRIPDVIAPRTQTVSPKGRVEPVEKSVPAATKARAVSQKLPEVLTTPEIVYMTDELWAQQPRATVRLELKSSAILEGRNIERFLIITPDYISVEKADRDHLKITALKRGSTFLHVWDDRGRWTFTVEVIMPVPRTLITTQAPAQEDARPFRLTHIADWNAYYLGNNFKNLERDNLDFLQRVLVNGETPYGDADGFVLISKFDLSTEVTGYGYGLSNGRIGNFEDFHIRGGDTYTQFSPLTLSGQTVRGGSIRAEAFDNNLEYTYMRGRDRSIVGFLSAGIVDTKESFIEGGRLRLFPYGNHQYALNFARGFGEARQSFLKERVTSIQTLHKLKDLTIDTELAYDDDTTAATVYTTKNLDQGRAFANLRHIGADYTTITSLPANRGEVGGLFGVNYDWKFLKFGSFLDLYRERFQPNPDDPQATNVDFQTTVDILLGQKNSIRSLYAFVNTPGELSPRKTMRFNSTYFHKLNIWGFKDLSAFAGGTYQRSRFKYSPASEYDRYGFNFGGSLPLIKNLNFYTNYEYSWVQEQFSGEWNEPRVLTSGFNYSKQLTEDWTGNATLSYRDEEKTDGPNTFLAGEDSVGMSLGATFRPSENYEFYVDGRVRNIWAESNERAAYNEADIRAGVRTNWDAPFSWNPKGKVEGIVYKDLNSNQHRDSGEEGIGDVKVFVGNKEVTTNSQGRFATAIRAKRAEVKVDMATIPAGFIFTTPLTQTVTIVPHRAQSVSFGLSSHSSIYGLVYLDKNANGKPDPDDEYIQEAALILDNEKEELTRGDGAYTFSAVTPGEHTIALDINSLPIQYLPLIKVKNTVSVEEGTTFVFHIPVKAKEGKK